MIHVLDTSALKWAYIPGSKHTRRCRYIVNRKAEPAYIAEITFLEIVSPLGSEVRTNRMSVRDYDRANIQFLSDIADGKLRIYPLPASEYIPCRYLLTSIGIDRRRSLKHKMESSRTQPSGWRGRIKLASSFSPATKAWPVL